MKLKWVSAFGIGLLFLSSCTNEEKTCHEQPEVIEEIKGFRDWAKIDESFGPDPFLSGRHGEEDSYRIVYKNAIADTNAEGKWVEGSILVKETKKSTDPEVKGGLTVMYKKGGDYNPDGGGWQWISVNSDFSCVDMLGDAQSAAFCHQCHTQANTSDVAGGDFVFHHPRSEVVDEQSTLDEVKSFLENH